MKRWLFLLLCLTAPLLADVSYSHVLADIVLRIDKLRPEFPQLAEFDTVRTNGLSFSYAYHTHRAARTGGWTSGVPNPDDDGVWFYIDFHDADTTAQIDTQPVVVPRLTLGRKQVMFLILEGSKTRPLEERIRSILRQVGVVSR